MHSSKQGVIKLDLNVTNRCNLRCQHCTFKSGRSEMPEMPLFELQKLFTEFKLQDGERVDLNGGEALLRKDLLPMVDVAKSLGIRVELNTNGVLLTESIIHSLHDSGLDELSVSIDGATSETNKIIRGYSKETFDRIQYMIKLASSLKIKTKINTVLFDHNFCEVPEITRRAFFSGASEHGVYYFSPTGSGENAKLKSADPFMWLNWIATMKKQEHIYTQNIKVSVETPIIETAIRKKNNLTTGCFMDSPWHLQILPDGKVYPCAIMCHHGVPIGDLNKQSLSQIWQDKDGMQKYYEINVKPMFEKWGGCVPYPFLAGMDKNQFEFVCLCRKFKLEEVAI